MGNVLEVVINPDIKLDPEKIKGMPEDLQGHLLVTMTIACQKYNCHWTELAWSVKFNKQRQPHISVKKK